MNSELLQNSEAVTRLLVLALPTVAAFLVSIVCIVLAGKRSREEGLNAGDLYISGKLFVSACATNFMYAILEVLLILMTDKIPTEMILNEKVFLFAVMGVANAVSCIMKGIIGAKSMKHTTGADKQQGLSRALIGMAVAEIPGLVALAVYMVSFMAGGK